MTEEESGFTSELLDFFEQKNELIMHKKSTTVELVSTLRKRNYNHTFDYIIERALRGVYHDFDSDLAMPKSELVKDLSEFPEQLGDIIEEVYTGIYDESPNQ